MILLADSGSTKTEWLLAGASPADTPVLVRTDGCNPFYQTTDAIVQTLREQLLPALTGAQPEYLYFYGAGCAGADQCAVVETALRTVFPAVGTVRVDSDMLGAARSVCGHEPGIACILGTGSNVASYDGERIISPGYSLGFWLGDEGSGGYLGKQLVVAYLQNQLPADLRDAFAENYPLDRLTVLDNAYNKPFPNRYFASFTPFLSQHRAHPVIGALLLEAFGAFFRLYVHRLPEAATLPVHLVGSVAYYFNPELKQAADRAGLRLGQLVRSPIDGLLAYHRPVSSGS